MKKKAEMKDVRSHKIFASQLSNETLDHLWSYLSGMEADLDVPFDLIASSPDELDNSKIKEIGREIRLLRNATVHMEKTLNSFTDFIGILEEELFNRSLKEEGKGRKQKQ